MVISNIWLCLLRMYDEFYLVGNFIIESNYYIEQILLLIVFIFKVFLRIVKLQIIGNINYGLIYYNLYIIIVNVLCLV